MPRRPVPARGRASEPEWGVPHDEAFPGLEEESEEDDDLGAPPPLPTAAVEPSTPPSDALRGLGPPPSDTLEAEKWAHSVLMRQAYETMMADLPETVRRKEVRTILRDAKGHVTDAARYDYMRIVAEERRVLEARKRGKADAKLVKRSTGGEGKIIPIRRDG